MYSLTVVSNQSSGRKTHITETSTTQAGGHQPTSEVGVGRESDAHVYPQSHGCADYVIGAVNVIECRATAPCWANLITVVFACYREWE